LMISSGMTDCVSWTATKCIRPECHNGSCLAGALRIFDVGAGIGIENRIGPRNRE
jgi:hypothetical protein